MRPVSLLLAAMVLVAIAPLPSSAAEKIRVVIVDGQNNHKWQETTPILQQILKASGRYTVDVATSPPKGQKDAMQKFHPDLAKYDVVVSNYNGEPWSDAFNTDLHQRLKAGTIGLVIVHAANNAFSGWKEYNQMIGMGWRGTGFGKRLKYVDGKPVIVPAGQDLGSGHRYVGPFEITLRDAEHPVTKGMPASWLHGRDELYDNMRGPVENVHVLATAFSDSAKKGTGTHEPMIWTVQYGQGRVFHTPMGHDVYAMQCAGFAAVLERGTEWAATGQVTIPLPKDFPTADKASIRSKK
ncbi:MAG: ThuA domain-containing protein [Bacteroidales bacterium]|nr:ThuA domain-containing protein [Bacteroidales bacterium]